MRFVVALLLVVAASAPVGDAHARRKKKPRPQAHEVRIDFDIGVANRANASFFDGYYLWTPSPLDGNDVAVPAVRRFVRHPTEVYFRAKRDGSTLDTRTGVHAGGALHLLGGLLYARGQAGIELDDVRYDGTEGGYTAVPYHLEAGGRPLPLLSLGAYFHGRPIIDSYGSDIAGFSTEREGGEIETGGTLSFATPDDRVLATVSAGYYRADWSFKFFNPGELDVTGIRATAQLSWQSSPTFSLLFRATGSREYWDNNRMGQGSVIDPPFERVVYNATADAGILYWHEQRYGFRFTLGGAFEGERPTINGDPRGYFRFGFGIVMRF